MGVFLEMPVASSTEIGQMCTCTFDLLWKVSCYVQCHRALFDRKGVELLELRIILGAACGGLRSRNRMRDLPALRRVHPLEHCLVLIRGRNRREWETSAPFSSAFRSMVDLLAKRQLRWPQAA